MAETSGLVLNDMHICWFQWIAGMDQVMIPSSIMAIHWPPRLPSSLWLKLLTNMRLLHPSKYGVSYQYIYLNVVSCLNDMVEDTVKMRTVILWYAITLHGLGHLILMVGGGGSWKCGQRLEKNDNCLPPLCTCENNPTPLEFVKKIPPPP